MELKNLRTALVWRGRLSGPDSNTPSGPDFEIYIISNGRDHPCSARIPFDPASETFDTESSGGQIIIEHLKTYGACFRNDVEYSLSRPGEAPKPPFPFGENALLLPGYTGDLTITQIEGQEFGFKLSSNPATQRPQALLEFAIPAAWTEAVGRVFLSWLQISFGEETEFYRDQTDQHRILAHIRPKSGEWSAVLSSGQLNADLDTIAALEAFAGSKFLRLRVDGVTTDGNPMDFDVHLPQSWLAWNYGSSFGLHFGSTPKVEPESLRPGIADAISLWTNPGRALKFSRTPPSDADALKGDLEFASGGQSELRIENARQISIADFEANGQGGATRQVITFEFLHPELTLCVDLGSSAIAASLGIGVREASPIPLGLYQSELDPAHEERSENRLMSSTVCLRANDKPGRGWGFLNPIYQTERVESDPIYGVWLEVPYPAARDVTYPNEASLAAIHDDGGARIIPVIRNKQILQWAFEGYKQLITEGRGAENKILTSAVATHRINAASVFEAALTSLLTSHISRAIAPLVVGNEQRKFDLSRTRLVLTYPSGLPTSTQETIYRTAGLRALEKLFGANDGTASSQSKNTRVRLISEAQATGFRVASTPYFFEPEFNEEATYPGPGRNRVVIADIGKSSADFCVAEFNTTSAGMSDLTSFRTYCEFGTRLGGHKLDELLRRRLESLIKDANPLWAPTPGWAARQATVIRYSKARWSHPTKNDEERGSVEIDLNVSQSETASPLDIQYGSNWVSSETIGKMFSIPAKKLERLVQTHISRFDPSNPNEQEIVLKTKASSGSKSGLQLVLSHYAPNGEPADEFEGAQYWRLVLRGDFAFLTTRLQAPNESSPESYLSFIQAICEHLGNQEIDGVEAPDYVWLLLTGRTTLYRIFHPDHFTFSRETMTRAKTGSDWNRLVMKSTPDPDLFSAHEALKSTVVDGAIELVEFEYDQNVHSAPELSFGLFRPKDASNDFPLRPLLKTKELQQVESNTVLVTAPPDLPSWETKSESFHHQLARDAYLLVRQDGIGSYVWVNPTLSADGHWQFFANSANAPGSLQPSFKLFPDGQIKDEFANSEGRGG